MSRKIEIDTLKKGSVLKHKGTKGTLYLTVVEIQVDTIRVKVEPRGEVKFLPGVGTGPFTIDTASLVKNYEHAY